MTVTTLIPSYQRPDRLLACLEGLLAGRRLPDEIVIVLRDTDAGSHKAVADWQQGVRAPVAVRVVIVAQPGQIAAINAGLPRATSEVVGFVDDDCVPREDWLERVMSHYAEPAVGGVGGRDVVHAEGLPEPPEVRTAGELTWYGRIIGNHHCNVLGGPRPVQHLKGVNMTFRRELVPHFDANIWGPHINDTDVSLSVSRRGHLLIFDPEAKVDHYPAQRLDNPGGRDLLDPRLTYLDSHDWMYLVLKHQPWVYKGVSALYILLVGTRLRPGLLLGLAMAVRRPGDSLRRMRSSLAGALAGIGSYLRPRPPSGAASS